MGIDSLKDFYGICKLHELSKACNVFDYAESLIILNL